MRCLSSLLQRCLLSFACVYALQNTAATGQEKWPDLSQLPPDSKAIEDGTNDLSNLLQMMHIDRVNQNHPASETPLRPDQLAAHYEMRSGHNQSIKRKSRQQILALALQFQDEFASWICDELDEQQRRWLFQQHIKLNGYQGLDCGWLATAMQLQPEVQDQIKLAVSEANRRLKPSKPKPRDATAQQRQDYAKEAKLFYSKRRELANELIWPLLNSDQQEMLRTAVGSTP